MIIGIDATNIKSGGGLVHLVELLKAVMLSDSKLVSIIIWGPQKSLDQLPDGGWIKKYVPNYRWYTFIWKLCRFPKEITHSACNVVFVPGGWILRPPVATVTMSQNMLPFEAQESRRYIWSKRLRLLALQMLQRLSFQRSQGIIFLSQYAKKNIERVIGPLQQPTAVIPHGIDARFFSAPQPQLGIETYSFEQPFKILYVSIIDVYKHQCVVAEAVMRLRQKNMPVVLELVGPGSGVALMRLEKTLQTIDSTADCVRYLGEIPHHQLQSIYAGANLFVFASSCENLPNILLEAMASGLPIASSNRGPMPEVLGDAGVYFDPENVDQMEQVLFQFITSPALRSSCAQKAYVKAQQYSWETCANQTLNFIMDVVKTKD